MATSNTQLTRTDATCPVCLNKEWQTSKDGGETWHCAMCNSVFEEEEED